MSKIIRIKFLKWFRHSETSMDATGKPFSYKLTSQETVLKETTAIYTNINACRTKWHILRPEALNIRMIIVKSYVPEKETKQRRPIQLETKKETKVSSFNLQNVRNSKL